MKKCVEIMIINNKCSEKQIKESRSIDIIKIMIVSKSRLK